MVQDRENNQVVVNQVFTVRIFDSIMNKQYVSSSDLYIDHPDFLYKQGM